MPYNQERVGYRDTDTSKGAADNVSASVYRQAVVDALRKKPMTADEIAKRSGFDRLTIRPRCTEHRELGLIEDSGTRRKNKSGRPAIVWQIRRAKQMELPL